MLDYDELRRSSAMAEEREKELDSSGGGGGISAMVNSLTPQQRFILALFLFFDVAILGCLLLFVLDVIALPI